MEKKSGMNGILGFGKAIALMDDNSNCQCGDVYVVCLNVLIMVRVESVKKEGFYDGICSTFASINALAWSFGKPAILDFIERVACSFTLLS